MNGVVSSPDTSKARSEIAYIGTSIHVATVQIHRDTLDCKFYLTNSQ